jgi:biotin carboxyl carrier protein
VKYLVTIEGRELPVEVDGGVVRVAGREITAHLSPIPGTPLRHLLLADESLTLVMTPPEPGRWEVQLHGFHHAVDVVDERTRHIRSLTGDRGARRGPAHLKAPMPGLVARILVTAGQAVSQGQGLVVLEAMKMENELRAAAGGTVKAIAVVPGQAVEKGQMLVELGD